MILAAVVLAIATRLLAEVVLARTDVEAVISLTNPTSRAALARGAEAPRYGIQPRVARKSPIDTSGTLFDGSVTGVGREQDRTNRDPEAQKTLINRY